MQLDYTTTAPTDLTSGGNNKQFFLMMPSIVRTYSNTTAAQINIKVTDASGVSGDVNTGIGSVPDGFNSAYNLCTSASLSGPVCFQNRNAQIDFTRITSVSVQFLYAQTHDQTNGVTTILLDAIMTTPSGGAAPPAPSASVTLPNGPTGAVGVQSFTLDVVQAPAITSLDHVSLQTGQPGRFAVTDTGSPAATLSETGALPGGVTFDAASGILSGTPAGAGGTYALIFTAANHVGVDATQNFILTITSTPVITSPNTATFNVGTADTFTVAASGAPAPVLKETGALPSGITFDATTGVLSGTPGTATGGTYPIAFHAANGIGADASQTLGPLSDWTPRFSTAAA